MYQLFVPHPQDKLLQVYNTPPPSLTYRISACLMPGFKSQANCPTFGPNTGEFSESSVLLYSSSLLFHRSRKNREIPFQGIVSRDGDYFKAYKIKSIISVCAQKLNKTIVRLKGKFDENLFMSGSIKFILFHV